MKRISLILTTFVGLAAALPAEPATRSQTDSQASRAKTSRPNLILVLADQLRYQSCGYAGDARARTPNLDAFAKEGVNFRNAISGHPVCAPYRASLFTGNTYSGTITFTITDGS